MLSDWRSITRTKFRRSKYKTMETSSTATAPKRGNGVSGKLYDVAKWDELKQLGWRSEGKDGEWFAAHADYAEKVGPAKTINALVTAVKLVIGNKFDLPKDEGNGVEIELDANAKGDRYLPGTAPVVNEQLSNAVMKYHETKLERVSWSNKETLAKDELATIAKIHENLFVPDPKKPGTKVYKLGNGVVARLKIVEDEVITTESETDKNADAVTIPKEKSGK